MPDCGNGCSDNSTSDQASHRGASNRGNTRVPPETDDDDLSVDICEEYDSGAREAVPPCQQLGKWKRLAESTDWEIVWPPMVIIMNTSLDKDKDDKWKGMENQELLDYFGDYKALKAHHACGPSGHLGMSVLIFESSALGYIEAERLHRHFFNQDTGRNAWKVLKPRLIPSGKRQLFGFLAKKADLEVFNKHRYGKSCLIYEMRSYHEMVVMQMQQITEDNKQPTEDNKQLKNKVQRSKAVEEKETLGVSTQKLRESMEKNAFVRSKAKEKHAEYEQELRYLEDFFRSQTEDIHKAVEDKEQLLEKLLQEERSKARCFDLDSGTTEERMLRKEHVQKFMDRQVKDVADIKAEKAEMVKVYDNKKKKLKKDYRNKELKLERELEAALKGLNQVELDELIEVHMEKKINLKKELMNKEVGIETELGASLMSLMEKHKPVTFEASSS